MNKQEKVKLSHTERHFFHSDAVGDDFTINVALPKNYNPQQKYPVVYLTDANVFFGLVSETAWLLQFGKEMPEVILVGIGYPDDSAHLTLRERDLAPTAYGKPEPVGHAKEFLSFLCDEVKLFINEKYSTDPSDSTLAGDSMGGLFGLYVLFHKPGAFQRYIIGSPSAYWDDSVIFQYEESYWEKHKSLQARVFLSAGQLEAIYEPAFAGMLSNVAKLTEILTSRKYEGLELTSHIFTDETHFSVIPGTFSRGLRTVFK